MHHRNQIKTEGYVNHYQRIVLFSLPYRATQRAQHGYERRNVEGVILSARATQLMPEDITDNLVHIP